MQWNSPCVEASGQGELNNDDAVKLRELERTAAVNKTLFEEFLQKAKITDEQATFRARDVRVIMPAQPGGQSFPNTRRTLLMALFIGLGLGVGGALAMEMLKAGFTIAPRSRAGAGNSRPGLCAQDEQDPTRQGRKEHPRSILSSALSALGFQRSHAHVAQRHSHVGCRPAA